MLTRESTLTNHIPQTEAAWITALRPYYICIRTWKVSSSRYLGYLVSIGEAKKEWLRDQVPRIPQPFHFAAGPANKRRWYLPASSFLRSCAKSSSHQQWLGRNWSDARRRDQYPISTSGASLKAPWAQDGSPSQAEMALFAGVRTDSAPYPGPACFGPAGLVFSSVWFTFWQLNVTTEAWAVWNLGLGVSLCLFTCTFFHHEEPGLFPSYQSPFLRQACVSPLSHF